MPASRTSASHVVGAAEAASPSPVTSEACMPLGPCTISNFTRWPSFRLRNPCARMAEKCTNTSAPPPSGVMKPKPLASLNHFTVPTDIWKTPLRNDPYRGTHPPRERVSGGPLPRASLFCDVRRSTGQQCVHDGGHPPGGRGKVRVDFLQTDRRVGVGAATGGPVGDHRDAGVVHAALARQHRF